MLSIFVKSRLFKIIITEEVRSLRCVEIIDRDHQLLQMQLRFNFTSVILSIRFARLCI